MVKKRTGRPGGRPGATGTTNVEAMMKKAQQMRTEMLEAQAELADVTARGEAAGGKVVAVVNGAGTITELVLDPEVVDPSEADLLSDLILVAVSNANAAMAVITEEKMGRYAAMIQGI